MMVGYQLVKFVCVVADKQVRYLVEEHVWVVAALYYQHHY